MLSHYQTIDGQHRVHLALRLILLVFAATNRGLTSAFPIFNQTSRDFGICGNTPTAPTDDKYIDPELQRSELEAARANLQALRDKKILVRLNLVYDATIEERYGRSEGVLSYLRQFIHSTQLVFEQRELDIGIEFVVVSARKSRQNFNWNLATGQILEQFTLGPDVNKNNADLDVLLLGRSMWRSAANSKPRGMAGVLGLANVGTFCREFRNNTLVVDALTLGHYRTLAHELAHAFNCMHDSEPGRFERYCSGQEFIMSPSAGPLRTRWSKCSKECLLNYFALPEVYECIFNSERISAIVPFRDDFDFRRTGSNPNRDKLPGELLDVDLQCKYASDDTAKSAQTVTGKNGYLPYSVCNELTCRVAEMEYQIGQATPGSTCNIIVGGKIVTGKCFEGRCDA